MSSSDNPHLELSPVQPAQVASAVAELLRDAPAGADPWWQAGLDDALADPHD